MRLAKERGILGFTADVLASNKGMMRVFEKSGLSVEARLDSVSGYFGGGLSTSRKCKMVK